MALNIIMCLYVLRNLHESSLPPLQLHTSPLYLKDQSRNNLKERVLFRKENMVGGKHSADRKELRGFMRNKLAQQHERSLEEN